MQERDFEEITRFLTTVGKVTLFEYLDVPDGAPEAAVDQAFRKRRSWAQGQQANPKYRAEALWIIKNQRLVRMAMVEHRDEYLERVRSRDEARGLEVLTLFIRGTLASGTLSQPGEQAIFEQGRNLGLSDPSIQGLIDRLVEEHGATRDGGDGFVDHYETLGIEPTATESEIDDAYRTQYRWARNLADKRKAREVYARLDAALRDLKDPARRAEYDGRYTETKGRPAGPRVVDEPQAYLPPPPEPPARPEPTAPSQASAGPRLAPARRDEDTAPPGTAPPVRRREPDDPLTYSSHAQRAAVPKPPQRIRGKTLSLENAGSIDGKEGTRLQLATPSEVSVKLGRRAETVEIRLVQVGAGSVTARVLADRNWVTVEPSRLGPETTEHVVTATVHPSRMPKNRGSSVVTIVPSHGPRLSVTIEAEQARGPSPVLMAVGALGLVLAVGVGTAIALWPEPEPEALPARVLQVRPDPTTAIVQVGPDIIGEGPGTWDSKLPEGPVTVQVSLDGFTSFEETVVIPPGETVVLTPRLDLADDLTYVPSSKEDGVELASAAVSQVVASHPELIQPCFEGSELQEVKLTGYLSAAGRLRGLQPAGKGQKVPPELLQCLGRGLRALRFTVTDPADYWVFTTTLRGAKERPQ